MYDDNIQRYEQAMELHHEQLQQRKRMKILSQMGYPNIAGPSPVTGYLGPSPGASPIALALPGPNPAAVGHTTSMAAGHAGPYPSA